MQVFSKCYIQHTQQEGVQLLPIPLVSSSTHFQKMIKVKMGFGSKRTGWPKTFKLLNISKLAKLDYKM